MPDFEEEAKFSGKIAGVDEAGRGPWAGPVVAGAVVIHDRQLDPVLLNGLNDSKKLTAKKREILYEKLLEAEGAGKVSTGIGIASAQEIDEKNILQATFLAMQRAVSALNCQADLAILDGNQKPKQFGCPVVTLIKGDAKSYSVAAASIMAKVYRDRLMAQLAEQYPYYGFEKNAGYGTALHIAGLQKYGVCPQHRRSYRPIQELLMQKTG